LDDTTSQNCTPFPTQIGNVAIFLEKGKKSDKYDFLELYLREWMKVSQRVARRCARRGLGVYANSTATDDTQATNGRELFNDDSMKDNTNQEDRDLKFEYEPQILNKKYFNREYDPYDWVTTAGTEVGGSHVVLSHCLGTN